jgi:hypothetical protein
VLWCSELQCGGLANREFFSDVTACGHGSLVVCVGVVTCISWILGGWDYMGSGEVCVCVA